MHDEIDSRANAGLEKVIEDPNAPYIVKQPHLCDRLDQVLRREDIVIDHVLIPQRDLFQAAESRRQNARRAPMHPPSAVTGGTFRTDSPEPGVQEDMLKQKTAELMSVIMQWNIPFTSLEFPRLGNDPSYLYEKVQFMLSGITRLTFIETHGRVWNPALVHDYTRFK
jgi:hypothetical protein